MRLCCAIVAGMLALGGPGLAEADIRFDIAPTAQCMAGTGLDKRPCIGLAAAQCMEATPIGGSTYGMGACLDRELTWWDDALNAAYQSALVKARAADAEMKQIGSAATGQAEALRAMQRAWIPFRDAKCAYEGTLWMGGTGGGPATLSCLLQTTAEQTLVLLGAVDY